ncbi:alkanesulfonate monooxygenase SsuD/methylene tetrahydromethanopterin reductase-like flavin-dependent oxidoreductase (luciferase family) [Pseudonocardia hierapolitana]|uniref:Alkanesulfonate monooxygenase SsuD/methylene tetrahydromethanopterin reductase-like flavin-dependent oxidoreductase (Luciferase family) n=1 Tax=Pseudonocardia hierapolitana TaxID=1128676 RepID=A0A561SH57_9PSEU|nr:LLM class flavin-dependent oxidoreductase [Pseudonocardia hierapolitana]TWF74200.1 alkanesulfonate monooxygenase SsuD/methylene tetrahydromethanopterin reductase-like flavin-dependent oxidoreductase (luciferase family) [Pseudonocardia hierapolitana]
MRVSLSVTQFPASTEHAPLERIVRVADEGGIDTVWVADHLVQYAPGTEPTDPHLEAYTTLGWLAGRSERVRLGAMVSPVAFRPATLLIKAVSTLDALSGGRAWLGIGAGYHEQEAAQMGIPMPPPAERFERLEDTLQLAHRMFAGDDSPFAGRRVRAERPLNHPIPARRPRILVGGAGEKKTLPLVARYADACNLFDIPDGGVTLRHKLEVLARECEAIGRPREEIETTVGTALFPDETPDAFAERRAGLGELGAEHIGVITRTPWTDADLSRLVEGARLLAA